MGMITPEEVIEFTGVKPKFFGFEKTETNKLDSLISKWIIQAEDLIISYTNNKFEESDIIPPAVSNVCLRLTANMVALAQSRKDTPIIKVNDWNVQMIGSKIFSDDLKQDLEPFIRERKSHKSDKIDFFCIHGD